MYWSTCLSPVSFFFCDPASVPRGLFSFRKCVNAAVRYPLGRKSTERHWNHRTRGLPTNFVFSPAIDRFHRPHSRDRSPVKRATKRIACLWNAPFTLFFLCSSPPQKKTFFFSELFFADMNFGVNGSSKYCWPTHGWPQIETFLDIIVCCVNHKKSAGKKTITKSSHVDSEIRWWRTWPKTGLAQEIRGVVDLPSRFRVQLGNKLHISTMSRGSIGIQDVKIGVDAQKKRFDLLVVSWMRSNGQKGEVAILRIRSPSRREWRELISNRHRDDSLFVLEERRSAWNSSRTTSWTRSATSCRPARRWSTSRSTRTATPCTKSDPSSPSAWVSISLPFFLPSDIFGIAAERIDYTAGPKV